MLLVNAPEPVPSLVFGSAVVGLAVVLQHTPLAVTDAPPSDTMLPPLLAVVSVIDVTSVVVIVGVVGAVLKSISLP